MGVNHAYQSLKPQLMHHLWVIICNPVVSSGCAMTISLMKKVIMSPAFHFFYQLQMLFAIYWLWKPLIYAFKLTKFRTIIFLVYIKNLGRTRSYALQRESQSDTKFTQQRQTDTLLDRATATYTLLIIIYYCCCYYLFVIMAVLQM